MSPEELNAVTSLVAYTADLVFSEGSFSPPALLPLDRVGLGISVRNRRFVADVVRWRQMLKVLKVS